MQSTPPTQRPTAIVRGLVAAASVVVIIAGFRSARVIIVPVLVAVFVSVVCAPIVGWLRRRGLPTVLAVLAVVMGLLVAGSVLTALVGDALTEFVRGLPRYQAVLADRLNELVVYVEGLGLHVPEDQAAFDPGAVFGWVAVMINSIRGLLTSGLLILLTIVFILLEISGFEGKLRRVLRDPASTLVRIDQFAASIKQYLAIKTMVSLITGVLVAVLLVVIGVEHWFLWGLLAFLLNFIPVFGSIIAAVPASLLALVELGIWPALLVVGGYLAINMVMGNLIEPRWAGYGMGLSPLVVFLSLILWGWVFGPVGLLLAAPLTMTLKLALESHPHTTGMAYMLGYDRRRDEPPTPHEPALEPVDAAEAQ